LPSSYFSQISSVTEWPFCRITTKYNSIIHCRIEIGKVQHFQHVYITKLIYKSNSMTGTIKFGYYLLNMTPPAQMFINFQTKKCCICY
jgi:hypothetical protein